MDEETFKTNLNTLKETVLDEEKLVTYYSISKDLCIHVNESKHLMKILVKEIIKSHPNLQLNVQFIISGLTNDDRARTMVCSEKDIEMERTNMKTVFFQHIYSLCKGKVDKVSLLTFSKFEDLLLCTGLVKSRICTKHTTNEIDQMKSNSQEAVTIQTKNLPKQDKAIKSEKTTANALVSRQNKSESTSKLQETKSEPVIKTQSISPKKEVVNSKHKLVISKNGKKSQKGITGFFSKSNSDPVKKVQKELKEEKVEKVEETDKETEIKFEKMEVDDDIKAETSNNIIPKKIKIETKLSQIKKNAKIDKKRKRLLHVSDSESEDENNDPFIKDEKVEKPESDDEIPPTPVANSNTVKVTSGMLNPKKKRKVVDKTYMDDEGYIHTKKEEVYESCSDTEEKTIQKKDVKDNTKHNLKSEISPKDKKKANGKKKPSPPQKGKQATLTNFFKRKE